MMIPTPGLATNASQQDQHATAIGGAVHPFIKIQALLPMLMPASFASTAWSLVTDDGVLRSSQECASGAVWV